MSMKIALGSDHAGFVVKKSVAALLAKNGYQFVDMGTQSEDSTDYPDYALKVATSVASGKTERGILACGTGIGMCIAANKVKGVRAAVAWSEEVAKLASEHNWTNVLCLPSRFLPVNTLKKIVLAWLGTPYGVGGRHERRVKKILKIESKKLRNL